ncbi:hypothetical protein CO667_31055 [Rhizobium sp. L43]|nr:hypothetical protein CO667_31055 [Rhizobium sp. L43]
MTKEHLMSRKMTFPGPKPLRDYAGNPLVNPTPLAETAKILCKNHNSGLSAFDTAGTNLFNAVEAANRLENGTVEINGNDLERFMMQRLCAHTFSNVATFRGVPLGCRVPQELIREIFTQEEIARPWGLYLTIPPEYIDKPGVNMEFAPFYNLPTDQAIGCRISFGRVSLAAIFGPVSPGLPLQYYRMAGFRFWVDGAKSFEIRLHWKSGAQSDFIDLDYDRTPVTTN